MSATPKFPDNPYIRRMESIFNLSEDERQALQNLPMQVAVLKDNQDIVREGDRPSRSCVILSGFACTYKITGAGKRQISAFHVPGDIPDLQSLHLTTLDSSVGTLSLCRVGFIPHEAIRELCDCYPRIASALWRESLISAAIFREWVTNVGRREAYGRMAHILCEMLLRLRVMGMAEGQSCELPITQTEFGDALGLSTVHVNRVLQGLRSDGLIQTKGTRLTVTDWEGLRTAGDFDPTYLHLVNLPGGGDQRGSSIKGKVFAGANGTWEAGHE